MDLVIRNGTVVDGSGGRTGRADVAVCGDRIVSIGDVGERGSREIDADGLMVTPGFIDAHTHMDAQVFWDQLGSSLCWHGVTSVVMGNCGFTLAPSRSGREKLVLDNLERAEDIPAEVMARGIDWTWESFPEYVDAVARVPKAINYATQIGHSALRTAVMGERAFGGAATPEDLAAMRAAVAEALRVGAIGFTTSISDHHETPDGRPVASRSTSWEELTALVDEVGRFGAGVFQLAVDTERTEADLATAVTFWDELRALAVKTGVPVTYGLRRQHLATQLEMLDAAATEGGRIIGQCQSTLATSFHSMATSMPFDALPVWRDVRQAPVAEQRRQLSDPDRRVALVAAAESFVGRRSLSELVVMLPDLSHETIGEIAARHGVSAIEAVIDIVLSHGFDVLFGFRPTVAQDHAALTAMRHPRTVMTFSDAGAHVRMISGADLQTTLLSRWVRERQVFTFERAVRMITAVPAAVWGLGDRGLLREGMIADINVIDPDCVAPELARLDYDLPGGAPRIVQRATGIHTTVIAGREVFRDGTHTGELPGALIRNSRARA